MNKSQSPIPKLALICAFLLIAACGGGGGGGDNQATLTDISFSSDRAVTVIPGVGGNPTGDAFWDQTATKYGIGDFNNDG